MLKILKEKKITLGMMNCFPESHVSLRKKDDVLKIQFQRKFAKADTNIIT